MFQKKKDFLRFPDEEVGVLVKGSHLRLGSEGPGHAEGLERLVRAHTEIANAPSATQHRFLWPSPYYLKFLFNCKHFKFWRFHVKIKISGFS